nr:type VI secretion system membrane subunit TssM [Sansalvadorimonas sp. 2012CJ34-2]
MVLSLAFVWGAVYIWPEALEWLDPVSTRVELTLLLIGVPLAIAGMIYGWRAWKRRQKRIQQDQELQYLRREKQRLNGNWKKLLAQLKKQPNGHNPYALPWLIMLGNDTAGKSSWLQHAGFERVQGQNNKNSSQDEQQHNDDVGFWISEHAVVLELAGHFLADETSELDMPVLQHLYSLLRKHRSRQPLTGILVAQPASHLITRQPAWLQEQARHLRRRLRELDTVTGIDLPIWLQVTQCDQLEGFQACFNQGCSNQRSYPLGIELPDGYRRDAWDKGFKELHSSLTEKLSDLLHSEKDANERQALGRFLLQMTLLQERLQISLEEIYSNRHHAPEAWLAGVWLSSTFQQGESFNLLANELGRSWSFQSARQQPQSQGNNSYFVRSFFPRVAVRTLASVGVNRLAHRFWQGKVLTGFVTASLLLGGGSWVLWKNVTHNQHLQNLTQQELSTYQAEIRDIGSEPELIDVIPPLLQLRELVQTFKQPRPWILRIGLFDENEARSVEILYNNQLQQRLFLPLSQRMNDTLSAFVHLGDYDEIFQHLLNYMMLYDPQIRNIPELNGYIVKVLADREELPEGSEQYLAFLLNDLWKTSVDKFEPDEKLIIQAQSDLGQRLDNNLVYDFIRSHQAHTGKVDIRNRLGVNFGKTFAFRTGFDGYYLPIIFTREGYSQLDLSPDSEIIKEAVANLTKVKGMGNSVTLADRTRISGKVRELYFLDYIRNWKAIVSNIELKPGDTLSEQLTHLQQLYQGDNPALFDLIAAIADQTQLEQPEPEEKEDPTKKLIAKQAEKKVAKAIGLKGASKKIASGAGRSALAKLEKQRSAAIVNEAFSAYATFFADKGAKLTEQLDLLNLELQQISANPDIRKAYFDSVTRLTSGSGSSLPELERLARQERTAAGVWLLELTDTLWADWMNGAGQYIQKHWQASVFNTWQSRLANRFPFANDVHQEVRLGDFVEFLRPQGELDQFVTTYLAPFVVPGNETSDHSWRIRPVNGATLPLSSALLKQLKQADTIRSRYFSADGSLDIGYRMRAKRLDSDITAFNLRDGNGNFTYSHGPQRWQERRWPQDPTDILSINFANNGLQLARSSYTGPWAWQHFVADSRSWEDDNQIQLTYQLKSYDVTLELDLDKRGNPFTQGLLTGFHLPGKILTGKSMQVDGTLTRK